MKIIWENKYDYMMRKLKLRFNGGLGIFGGGKEE